MAVSKVDVGRRYDKLEFRPGIDIPYLGGTNFRIRADIIYCLDYKVERHDAERIARNRDLPVDVVAQAIEWGIKNDDLISMVLARENAQSDRSLGR